MAGPTGEPVRLRGDGLEIAGEAFGDIAAPPVLFFHGGGQSRRSWAGSARRLGDAGYRGITCDLRGHGDSGWAADGDYLLGAYARDVTVIVDGFDRPLALVGASRGGQSALVGAAHRPDKVALVVLADVAPHIDDGGVDAIRGFFRASDNGFASPAEAADALHLHLGQPRVADVTGLARSLREVNGRWFWHWDPRTAGPAMLHPPSESETMVAAACAVRSPVVLVKAEHSTIVSDESVAAFLAMTPQLQVETAFGVGHMFTGDRNDAFAETVLRYLARHMPL